MGWNFMGFHKENNSVFKIMTVLVFLSWSSISVAQLNLNLNTTTTSVQTTVSLPSDDILFLKINVYDADYNDEVTMNVNGQGMVTLFPGGDSGNNDSSSDILVNLNNTQKGYFRAGSNTLTFTLNTSDPKYDGVRINEILAVDKIETISYEEVVPLLDQPISAHRTRALAIFKRVAGIGVPIDSPILIQMENQIASGNLKAAAELAADQPSFLNLVVRDFAARMSTREETINEPMNDFIATFIGVTRDELDARLLLMGDLFYMASPATPVASNIVDDVLRSNRHYDQLVEDRYDFASVLSRVNNQYLRLPGDAMTENPDAAGVITSRAFMGAHGVDGTNRRLVEYTFKQFTCNDMEDWADAKATDIRVGRDIDRFPGGEGSKYLTTCKACHSNMDGFRGAFAKYDFEDGFVKHGSFYGSGGGRDRMDQRPAGIASKMNANRDTFSAGFETVDDSWINNARSPANEQRFGWRGVVSSGNGVKQMATAVANSQAFSRCMTKKVYREVCRRSVASFEQKMVESVALSFENSGYNLKDLFTTIAARPECLGVK